jgi:hypothetical protein
MRQSLDLTTSMYEALDGGLNAAARSLSLSSPRLYAALVSGALDALVLPYVPGFWAWNHEEFHRAVLSRRGFDSKNSVNRFPFGKELIPVDHVKDLDLISLKAAHPAEMVRLSTAGMEGDVERQIELGRVSFFYRTRGAHWVQLALTTLNVSGYMYTCATNNLKTKVDANAEEDTEAERDFTGLDCVAAVYDMHRPNEPYINRGPHPSGTGIDRYIAYEELAKPEQQYLRRQAHLSLLNVLNPNIIGFEGLSFVWRNHMARATANVLWQPAPFGQTVGVVGFLSVSEIGNFVARADAFASQHQTNPGLSVQAYDIPLGQAFSMGARLALWLQPKGALFITNQREVGALASVRVDWNLLQRFTVWVEFEAKSAGWVPGQVYLDRNASSRFGTTLWW